MTANLILNGDLVKDPQRTKKPAPPYPFYAAFLGIYPILHLFAENIDRLEFRELLWPCSLVLPAVLVLQGIIYAPSGSTHKSALLAALLVLLFYSYGFAQEAVYKRLLSRAEQASAASQTAHTLKLSHLASSSFFLCLFILLAFLVLRSRKSFAPATSLLNICSVLLLAMSFFQISSKSLSSAAASWETPKLRASSSLKSNVHPDIYFIVLDGYARGDVLNSVFEFNNKKFLRFLSKRSFQIAKKSSSSYFFTFLSLSSTLNMRYLDFLSEKLGENADSRALPYRMIRENSAASFLRKLGYKYVHINSTWGATVSNSAADIEIPCSSGYLSSEFHRELAETTWLKAAHSWLVENMTNCLLEQFSHLSSVSSSQGPKFVFAHFVLPHPPFIFGRSKPLAPASLAGVDLNYATASWNDKSAYVNQLRFVNKHLMEAVKKILTNSSETPVIIIQSDHGPRINMGDYSDALDMHFANLSAVLNPYSTKKIPSRLAAVNTFPLVFNSLFESSFKMLPSRRFFSSAKKPYAFTKYSPAEKQKLYKAFPNPAQLEQ